MTVSFGRIIPVQAYIKNTPANKEQTIAISDILCAYLEKRDYYPNNYLAEQQRRFFKSQVSDYKLPEGPYRPNDDAESAVFPFSVEEDRYLATGEDIAKIKEYGRDFGRHAREANGRINERLSQGIDKLKEQYRDKENSQELKKAIESLKRQAEDEKKAEHARLNKIRIEKVRTFVNTSGRKIPKTLNVQAIPNPEAKKDKEAYTINLIDFKA